MSTRVNDDGTADGREPHGEFDGTPSIESYETDDGVVFYDAENPLAWVETNSALSLEELV